MAIEVTKYPNAYSFVGNSIIFELQKDSNDYVSIELTVGDKNYVLTYYPYQRSDNQYIIHANLSDYLKFESELQIPEDDIIVPIQDFRLPYHVKIGNNYQFYGIALRGGISNHLLRQLAKNGYDLFSYRLLSPIFQFLFTTRTNGREIRLKDTELFPFVFIHLGFTMIFRSESGYEITIQPQPAATFCAMNIRLLLEQFPTGTKRIEVCPGGDYAFHFTILPSKLSEEKYLLRFRNSLGAFEVLEVSGKAMHTPEFSEESKYENFDDEFNIYEEHRSRVNSKGIIEVETGYKDRLEFPFILDLLQSDEIYFIYPGGDLFRCHVNADSVQFRQLMTEPTSIKLKIREVTDEEFTTPKIEFPDDLNRIFDEEFGEQFI